jgi:hypothetical protein
MPEYISNLLLKEWKEKWLTSLSREMGLSSVTIRHMVDDKKYKHSMWSIDLVYDFFGLDKLDEFYTQSIAESYNKSRSPLWEFLRKKRAKKLLSLEKVEYATNVSRRTVMRIELWEYEPSSDSDSLSILMRFYEVTKEEKDAVNKYCLASRKLSKLSKS